MSPVVLSDEAIAEFAAAANWYEEQHVGLGQRFLDDVDSVIGRITEHPSAFPTPPAVDPTLGIRRALCPSFPYAVIYIELSDEIRVLAVCHTRRRPAYWLERLDDEE